MAQNRKEIYCTIKINGHNAELKIDTGARCNVLALSLLKRIKDSEIINKSKPDKDTIKAIKEMPITDDGPEALQRFLGMVNYLHKFIDNISEKTALLCQLLNKDTKWFLDVHRSSGIQEPQERNQQPSCAKIFHPARQLVVYLSMLPRVG